MSRGNYLNSIEAAKLLGVNVSTIKRWTDSGKLSCIQTPGGHRKFLMKHINEYLKNNGEKTSQVSVLPYDTSEHRQINHLIQKKNLMELNSVFLNAALNSEREVVNMIITGLALSQTPLFEIFDDLITPVLYEIGNLWEAESISIAEEHIASELIRDSILLTRQLIQSPENEAGKVLCFTLKDDIHDISLKLVQIILENRGFDVRYIGQRTPAVTLEKIIALEKPERVYISSTYYSDSWTKDELDDKYSELELIYILSQKYDFEIFIGGQAFDKLQFNKKLVKRRLYTYEDVCKY